MPSSTGSTESVKMTGDLSVELRMLDAARAAIARSDTAGALRFLDDYARAYPKPRLGPEATILRIEALARSGDRDEARRLSDDLLARYPDGPYRARLRRVLDAP
jgi:hypothetical protein